MYDGRPVGLSKGFLGYQLTGVYPEDQRRNIINDLLQLSQQGKGSGFLGSQYTKFGMGDAGFDKEFTKSINESSLSESLKNRLLDTSYNTKTSKTSNYVAQQNIQKQKDQDEKDKRDNLTKLDSSFRTKDVVGKGTGYSIRHGFDDGGFIGGSS